jgi:hypothetical protein
VAVLCLALVGATDMRGQLPVRTRLLRLMSDNANAVEFLAPLGLAATRTYTLPSTIPIIPGAVLRIATSPAPTATSATLEWTPEAAAAAALFSYTTADQSLTSTTMTDLTLLGAAGLVAAKVYEFEALIAYDGTSTDASLKLSVAVTPAPTLLRWTVVGADGIGLSPNWVTTTTGTVIDLPVQSSDATRDNALLVKGIVVVSASTSTLQLRGGVTSSGTIRILQGSYVKASRMTN